MTRLVVVSVAIIGALMLQTVVGYQLFGRVIAMDLVLVVVVGTALFFGPTAGHGQRHGRRALPGRARRAACWGWPASPRRWPGSSPG